MNRRPTWLECDRLSILHPHVVPFPRIVGILWTGGFQWTVVELGKNGELFVELVPVAELVPFGK